MKQRASVFASGTGSNFEAMMQNEKIAETIVLLICDRPGAAVVNKAQAFGIPTLVVNPKEFPTKQAYETVIYERLQSLQVDWIFLAGYMRLIGETLLKQYEGRIINIHPSLLPHFPGKDAIGQAFRAGAVKTGVTIHYVDEGMDTGPIIAQEEIKMIPGETEEQLKTRIQALEHRLYPTVINQLMKNVTEELS